MCLLYSIIHQIALWQPFEVAEQKWMPTSIDVTAMVVDTSVHTD